MNNDKIGANAGKLKGRELRPLILCIFFFRLIQAIKDVLTEINLACTPNPILLRGLSLSQCPLHSDIHLHLFAYGPFHLLGHGIQHYIVLPHYSHNKTRKHISKHQSLTRTLSLCRCKIPNNWNNGISTFGPVNFQKQYFSFRWEDQNLLENTLKLPMSDKVPVDYIPPTLHSCFLTALLKHHCFRNLNCWWVDECMWVMAERRFKTMLREQNNRVSLVPR